MKRILLSLAIILSAQLSKANNITIQKVSLLDTNRTAKTVAIRINISWENSWRDSINWDAAWIFFKYKEPKDSVWRWRHGTLSKTGNYAGNSSAAMKFAIPDDLRGAFLYRQAIGSGNIKADSVRLLWNYGADGVTNIDSVEIRVFATEMVYVPEGSFAIGDGNGKERTNLSFQLKNAPNNYAVITNLWSPLINTFVNNNTYPSDDVIIYRDGIRISGTEGLDINNDKVAENKDFPTGYRSFYSMKYEVTQGQYADFLNTLSLRDTSTGMMYMDTSRLKKVPGKLKLALQNVDPFYYSTPVEIYRHSISLDTVDVRYRVSRPDRAYGQGNTNHLTSFADWAGLRPMSELEYEKACRGPLPPYYWNPGSGNFQNGDTSKKWWGADWAWGNDTTIIRINNMYATSGSKLQYSGVENGMEFFTNYDVYRRYINPIQTWSWTMKDSSSMLIDNGNGPFRVGIFANDSSTRISSGAGYYGIMDLSKNVSEYVVSLGSSTARTFSYKIHGDGMLDAYGQSRDFLSNNNGGPGMNIFIQKSDAVSSRNSYGSQGTNGFRAVRTAPTDN